MVYDKSHEETPQNFDIRIDGLPSFQNAHCFTTSFNFFKANHFLAKALFKPITVVEIEIKKSHFT